MERKAWYCGSARVGGLDVYGRRIVRENGGFGCVCFVVVVKGDVEQRLVVEILIWRDRKYKTVYNEHAI